MKCAYKQVQTDRRIADVQKTYDGMSIRFLQLLDAASGITMHEHHGFGKTRLERMYVDVMTRIAENVQWYTADMKTTREQRSMFSARAEDAKERGKNRESILDASFSIARDLERIGYHFSENERSLAYVDHFGEKWHPPRMQEIHQSRVQFADRMQPTCALYIVAVLYDLHERYGYGADRLRLIHREIRRKHNEFVENWLNLMDKEAFGLLDGWMKTVEGYGVEMTYWESEEE